MFPSFQMGLLRFKIPTNCHSWLPFSHSSKLFWISQPANWISSRKTMDSCRQSLQVQQTMAGCQFSATRALSVGIICIQRRSRWSPGQHFDSGKSNANVTFTSTRIANPSLQQNVEWFVLPRSNRWYLLGQKEKAKKTANFEYQHNNFCPKQEPGCEW